MAIKILRGVAVAVAVIGFTTSGIRGANFSEDFSTDPVLNGRFVTTNFGTETSFVFDATNQTLLATLDVDFSAAYYLSTPPFAPIRSTDDANFSFNFRVLQMDTRILPTAFVGLLTTNHVGNGGDGLTVALSSSTNQLPVVSATVDQGPLNFGGDAIQLALGRDYLALGRYSASNLQFTVEIYGGPGLSQFIGRSVTYASAGLGFSLDRLGLQNGGGQSTDQTNGSITVVVDNLFIPARTPLSVSISDASVTETDAGTSDATFVVILNSPSVQTVRVDYATADVSALAGQDYISASGNLIFPPGMTTQIVVVPIIGDRVAEPTETFEVTLTNAVNAGLGVGTAVGTILDNDTCLVSIDDAGAAEIRGGTTNASFNVSLSVSNREAVYVSFATSNGTARAGFNYGFTNGVLTFLPGVTHQTIPVSVLDDRLDQPDETFFVDLIGITNALCGRCRGLGTITNSTPPPVAVVAQTVSVKEGDSGVTNVEVLVALSAPSGKPINICYSTSNATAIAGSDYLGTINLITINPGETNAVIPLGVLGDTIFEPDETFSLYLICVRNAVLGNSRCDVVIQNDDPKPTIDVSDAGVVEGNSGTTNAVFRAYLSNPTYQTVTVDYFTADVTANSGSDYVGAMGSLTFFPGVTNLEVSVTVMGDSALEADESFRLVLTNIVNASPGRTSGTGVITNDDFACVSISDTNVIEGNSGTRDAVFSVQLSAPAVQPVSVRYMTRSGTAMSGSDFIDTAGLLTFPVGVTNLTVRVPVVGDTMDEPDEIFFVALTNLTNAVFCRSVGTGTILDDDPTEIHAAPASVLEGNAGTTPLPFQIQLSSTNSAVVTVTFLTKDGSAQGGIDYIPTNGTLTFLPGESTKTVIVSVLGDRITEPNETLFLCLSNAVNARLIETQVQGTIIDDDAPCLSLTSVTVQEPFAGTTNSVVRFGLDHPSSLAISFDYALSNGTATTGTDFIGAAGTLVFAPGVTNTNVVVVINGDAEVETNETFFVVLSNPINVQLCQSRSTNVIIDNTIPPIVTAYDSGRLEGDAGIGRMFFTARLSRPSPQKVSVDFSTADGSALAGEDYRETSGTVYFDPGITVTNFSVPIFGDCMLETNELFFVNLTNAHLATLGTARVVGVITNDDSPPTVLIDNGLVQERDLDATNMIFALSLSCPSSFPASIGYATVDDTALAGIDYVATNGVVVFPPGVTSATVSVSVLGDFEEEAKETFFLRLFNPTIAALGTNRAIGTIVDDDGIVVSILDAPPVNEGETVEFTVLLSKPPTSDRTVSFATLDVSANAGFDYVPTNGVLRFPPGVTSQSVSVTTIADGQDETNENFVVVLGDPVHVSLGRRQGVGTIIDGDPPCISINDLAVRDNGTGNNPADYTVSLSSTSSVPISVRYTTTNGTAIAGPDFVPASGVLTIPAGMTNGTIHVSVLGNTQDETNEYFSLILSAPTNAAICKPNGICTIFNGTNVNNPPFVALTNPRPNLCLITPTNVLLTASASDSDGLVLRVDFYADATNFLGRSFAAPYQILWFNVPAGAHELTAVALDNAEKTATSGPIHLEVSLPAVVSVTNVSLLEGDAGTNLMLFPIRLASPSCQTVKVDVATSGGNALAGVDYLPVPRTTVTFLPGLMEQVVSVPILGDTLIEPDETFFVVLTNAVNATIGSGAGLGTILNDDSNSPPIVIITNPSDNDVFFTPPGIISICADAYSSNGIIRQVDFYAGTNFIGRGTNAPFCAAWTNNVVGTYDLTAIATDNADLRGTSAPVRVRIQVCQISVAPLGALAVCPGESAIIGTTVTNGSSTATFVWRKDGNVLAGQTNASIVITNATAIDSGIYSLEIIGCTRITNSGSLTVRTPLSATMPTNTVACSCSDYVIGPVVTGTGPFRYVWKKDGTALPGETNGVLNLGKANTIWPAVFTVEITGPCTSVTNSTVVSLNNVTSGEWTNSDSMIIPEFGLAEIYPSQIPVQCAPGPITELRVTLRGLSHSFPDDLDILLVGPDGTAVALMSDAGGGTGNRLSGIDVTFDDNAAAPVPDFDLILPGSYRPANYLDVNEGPDFYPPPAPAGANATQLSAFFGSDPNGVWSLYIVDDHGRDGGSLTNGWVLDFGSEAFLSPAPSLTDLVKTENGSFQMMLHGQPNKTYFVEASADLQRWDLIQTRVLGGTAVTVVDTMASQFHHRFYRVSGCRN